MRLSACPLVVALAALGCDNKPSGSGPAPGDGTDDNRTTLAVPPRAVEAAGTSATTRAPAKSLANRPTAELIAEVEKPDQKNHLPIIAELAARPKEKAAILPVMMKLQVHGIYAVRVAAATARLALDPEKASDYTPALGSALNFRHQHKSYGPIVDDPPELRKIQKLAVNGLVRVIEQELNDPKRGSTLTGPALGALMHFPLEAGKPAIGVVARVAAHPTSHDRIAAQAVLKKWGTAE